MQITPAVLGFAAQSFSLSATTATLALDGDGSRSRPQALGCFAKTVLRRRPHLLAPPF
jgi:hypothetical protein